LHPDCWKKAAARARLAITRTSLLHFVDLRQRAFQPAWPRGDAARRHPASRVGKRLPQGQGIRPRATARCHSGIRDAR